VASLEPGYGQLLQRRVFVAAAAAAVLTVTSYAGGLVLRSPVNWFTVLALPPFAQGRDHLRLVAGTLVAVAGATVLLVVGRRSRAVAAAGLAVVLIFSSVALRLVLIEAGDRWNYATQPTPLATVDALNSATEVGYDTAAYNPGGLYGYQWQLDRTHFRLFDSRHDPIPSTKWSSPERIGCKPDRPARAEYGSTQPSDKRYGAFHNNPSPEPSHSTSARLQGRRRRHRGENRPPSPKHSHAAGRVRPEGIRRGAFG
jgi:hypothetical protein